MTPEEMKIKMEEYEGLVISTTRYWRRFITSDLLDEDIEQELRMKVWRALETFNPDIGYPERNHVFGAVRNRIKDLIGKKKRENFETSMLEEQTFSGLNRGGTNNLNESENRIAFSKHEESVPTDLIQGLPRAEQRVAILMVQGYNAPEISQDMGITVSTVRSHIARVREHVSSQIAKR